MIRVQILTQPRDLTIAVLVDDRPGVRLGFEKMLRDGRERRFYVTSKHDGEAHQVRGVVTSVAFA